ncbi:I78 family peptidase inhibitor [Pseudoxanthomonas sp. SE1]|uniref:I78 family peptidase inhibitor n=1 Tax=Pseudoxanthomonas sp. SE1 TaxID=1664560 RepID=UPI00240CF7E8|nr:I78 family peptidase inhibitor [Pseudoxanthomonas sp. SE1]WFC41922.1 I78 family peptidase inhibitor [Pseudoxanthomonas sp. SE1]
MIRTAIPALLLTLSLAACSAPDTDEQTAAAEQAQAAASEAATPPPAQPAPTELAGTCDDTQAQWIIGKTPSEKDIEQAKTDSKSDSVRALKPGDAATMDFNPDRLNIILDDKGAATSVNCG